MFQMTGITHTQGFRALLIPSLSYSPAKETCSLAVAKERSHAVTVTQAHHLAIVAPLNPFVT